MYILIFVTISISKDLFLYKIRIRKKLLEWYWGDWGDLDSFVICGIIRLKSRGWLANCEGKSQEGLQLEINKRMLYHDNAEIIYSNKGKLLCDKQFYSGIEKTFLVLVGNFFVCNNFMYPIKRANESKTSFFKLGWIGKENHFFWDFNHDLI